MYIQNIVLWTTHIALKTYIKVSQKLQGMKLQWEYLKAGRETAEHLIFLGKKTKLFERNHQVVRQNDFWSNLKDYLKTLMISNFN